MKKTSTVALILTLEGENSSHVETLSDDAEIQFLETVIREGEPAVLERLYEQRKQLVKQENEFGDYLEDLLSQPFLNPEIQQHAVRWLKSKIRIEEFQKTEKEAAKIIAEYAYKIFRSDPSKTDFLLASPNSEVRIRIFLIPASIGART